MEHSSNVFLASVSYVLIWLLLLILFIKDGMYIYARASAKGKRVQVSALP